MKGTPLEALNSASYRMLGTPRLLRRSALVIVFCFIMLIGLLVFLQRFLDLLRGCLDGERGVIGGPFLRLGSSGCRLLGGFGSLLIVVGRYFLS